MTLLTPDPDAARVLSSLQSASDGSIMPSAPSVSSVPRRPQNVSPTHSIPENPVFPHSPHIVPPTPARSSYGSTQKTDHEQAINLATHSWDLATGGLKTLTAKRELPVRPDRRVDGVVPDILATSRSYMFVLVILGALC